VEVCIALDAATGAELWATRVRGSGMSLTGAPPYSTPTVDGDRVYVLSTDLVLFCLDAATGQVIWQTDLIARYGGTKPSYGSAASPTVDGDFVFVNSNAQAGDRLLAFRKTDGSLAWKAAGGPPEYATPIAATILGRRQIIFSTESELMSVAPESGVVLWRCATNAFRCYATPVVAGDTIVVADLPSTRLVRVTQSGEDFEATQVWAATGLRVQWTTPVCRDGYLYGLFMWDFLACVDLATARAKWTQAGFRSSCGGILLVDGHLLILTQTGELVLVEPTPAAYTELARFQALTGDCYNHPAIYNGRIYARSTKEAVCFDVAVKPLKLQPPSRQTDGSFQLLVTDAAGNDLPLDRLAQVEVLAASDPGRPLTNWVKLTNTTVLTNGMLQVNDPEGAHLRQRFFMGVERR
jgi:outer membrane protein assembly factor BamB